MQIWIDADACPTVIKEMIYKAAMRTSTPVTLVANQPMRTPDSKLITSLLAPRGLNAADQLIVEKLSAGDLVITADIPLASDVVGKDALALDPRGELYDQANIGERLAIRDLMDHLRGGGHVGGGPSGITAKDKQAFANQLDRWLARRAKAQAQADMNVEGDRM